MGQLLLHDKIQFVPNMTLMGMHSRQFMNACTPYVLRELQHKLLSVSEVSVTWSIKYALIPSHLRPYKGRGLAFGPAVCGQAERTG